MKVVSIINLKGGVGKTTTAAIMAESLAEIYNKRVLLFDNDKQGNISRLFDLYNGDIVPGACVALKSRVLVPGTIQKTAIPGVDLVNSNYFMELAENEIRADQESPQHDRYKAALAAVAGEYDYCIVDNPPDLGINVINAIVATDEVIIPVNLDGYSLDGLEELAAQVKNIRALNPKVRIAGCLVTDFEKSDYAEAAEIWLRTKSGLHVYSQHIRHYKKAKDATIAKKTITKFCIRSGAAQDYKKIHGGIHERGQIGWEPIY